jgi:hypothetical protein
MFFCVVEASSTGDVFHQGAAHIESMSKGIRLSRIDYKEKSMELQGKALI